MDDTSKVQGEGDYEAARNYRRKTEAFIQSGRVEDAAKNAAPTSDAEARELEQAEEAGRSHTAEDDPDVR